ncbi:Rho/RAC guanine nucleotide exchange factor, putative [Entamoeba invadens IP1]|uniref:Rho/RAC guanine nucleotide exchange factor, putative n=1 Tax=Entamoeba invadens IP1 TaxID=370355 RepID=A0A0A1TUR1_ENTIV|nr:Rho/RAC guanine nucleotide exchange factor, putative [Entamoeba invadens IP1]ELP83845.1 Rho/RAC guanine nucleotide exchange factor, putative [Entamoeba invadens IP1]|eukprot:XP_004183191.1 Rho/RAC guanine nucleotide exchange factor, putative [Entamoeba invadens IP1]
MMKSRREQIIDEIYTTEEFYILSMQCCIDFFYTTLKDDRKSPVSFSDVENIFKYFNDILEVNKKFYLALRRLRDTHQLYTTIGNTFKLFIPFFKDYFYYISHYDTSSKIISKYEADSKYETFMADLIAKIPTSTHLDLRSYLIMPVQRLPRYQLLLQDLLKHTEKTEEDYLCIEESLQQIKSVTQEVNNKTKAIERKAVVIQTKRNISGLHDLDLSEEDRFLVKEGVLMKVCKKTNKLRYFYLFNDLMIYGIGNQRIIVSEWFYLRTVRVEVDTRFEYSFKIKNNKKSFTVICGSKREMKGWYDEIEKYSDEERRESGSESEEGILRPVWIPDNETKCCLICHDPFTFVNRRHHCRMCGRCICGDCSRGKIQLAPKGPEERVCKICFAQAMGMEVLPKIEKREKSPRTIKKEVKDGKSTSPILKIEDVSTEKGIKGLTKKVRKSLGKIKEKSFGGEEESVLSIVECKDIGDHKRLTRQKETDKKKRKTMRCNSSDKIRESQDSIFKDGARQIEEWKREREEKQRKMMTPVYDEISVMNTNTYQEVMKDKIVEVKEKENGMINIEVSNITSTETNKEQNKEHLKNSKDVTKNKVVITEQLHPSYKILKSQNVEYNIPVTIEESEIILGNEPEIIEKEKTHNKTLQRLDKNEVCELSVTPLGDEAPPIDRNRTLIDTEPPPIITVQSIPQKMPSNQFKEQKFYPVGSPRSKKVLDTIVENNEKQQEAADLIKFVETTLKHSTEDLEIQEIFPVVHKEKMNDTSTVKSVSVLFKIPKSEDKHVTQTSTKNIVKQLQQSQSKVVVNKQDRLMLILERPQDKQADIITQKRETRVERNRRLFEEKIRQEKESQTREFLLRHCLLKK